MFERFPLPIVISCQSAAVGCFLCTNLLSSPSEMQLSLGTGLLQDSRSESASLLHCGVRTRIDLFCHLNRRRNLAWQSNYQKWDLPVNHIMNTKFTVPGTLPGHLNSLNSHTYTSTGVSNAVVSSLAEAVPRPTTGVFLEPMNLGTLLFNFP